MLPKHYVARLTTKPTRRTAVDPSACPLLPGGLGQWVAKALQLSTTVPYLLLWAHIMAVEGTPPGHNHGHHGWRPNLTMARGWEVGGRISP